MAEQRATVDHFPDVIKHFSDEQLMKLAIHYAEAANSESANHFVRGRGIKCREECKRRGIRIPRRGQTKLVA